MTNQTVSPMLYRNLPADEEGFADPQEQYEAMRDYAQSIMERTDPNDIMDTLCVMANVCEMRGLQSGSVPARQIWYLRAAKLFRTGMLILNEPGALPNAKFEDPLLYFPEVKDIS